MLIRDTKSGYAPRRGYTTLMEISIVAALAIVLLPVIALTVARTIGAARLDRSAATGAMDAMRLRESLERDAMFATAVSSDGSGLSFAVPGQAKAVYRLESDRLVRRQGERTTMIVLNPAKFDCAVSDQRLVRVGFAPYTPRGGARCAFDISVIAGGVR